MQWFCSAVAIASFAVPAFGQINVYIGGAPPPLRYERRPPMPGEGFGWVDGYWGNDGRNYSWVPGRWDRPPYTGAYWSHPHYDHYNQGWQMHEGHWDHEDHGRHKDHGDHGDHDGHDDHHR